MNAQSDWLARYIALIVVAVFLSATLGATDFFRTASLVDKQLTASHLVRFLGYGFALIVFWRLARRLRASIREDEGRRSVLKSALMPLATLVVVGGAHSTFMLVLDLWIDGPLFQIYNWLFVGVILACALWLVFTLFGRRSPLIAMLDNALEFSVGMCLSCNAPLMRRDRFCSQCGVTIVAPIAERGAGESAPPAEANQ
ncbi:MAG: hypothetical protein ACKVQT_06005 [Burkholderiales bacterium]